MQKILFSLLIAGSLAASTAPSFSDPTADAAAAAPAAAATPPAPIAQPITATAVVADTDKDADMIICHENQAATGSRLGASRECHPKREWDKRHADNKHTIENAQQIGLTGNPKVPQRIQ